MSASFDGAWRAALERAEDVSTRGVDVILVRDLLGRVSMIVDEGGVPWDDTVVRATASRLTADAAPFVSGDPVVRAGDLFEPDMFRSAPERVEVRPRSAGRGSVHVLERGVVGGEWLQVRDAPPGNRLCVYGFKGGVGRSTAAFMLAKVAAERGLGVLVVDLDLESPGVGDLLLTPDELPEHGLLDHLVEHAVGNAEGLDLVASSTQVATSGNGEIWVCPPRGRARPGYDYLPKLNRAYLDVPALDGRPATPFGERLELAIAAGETEVARRSREPDLVVLDSRAGLHDIAAVAISQLSDTSFLFAADSPQTWAGYRELFGQWQSGGRAQEMRERLKMVASMVPEIGRDAHLSRFRDHAQSCFADTLYDDEGAGEVDSFNPQPEDTEAPHSPLAIDFVGALVGLDAGERREWHEARSVEDAYAEFADGVLDRVLGGGE